MDNCLLEMENDVLAAKKMRTGGGIGWPTSTLRKSEPTRRRKTQITKISKQLKSITETRSFKEENYRGALQEYLQKQGDDSVSFQIKPKIGSDTNVEKGFICTCKAGGVTATAEARGKKLARQLSALALIKKMKLLPAGYKSAIKVAEEAVQPKVAENKSQEKKSQEELLAERDYDEENIYSGIVSWYKADKEYGIISIDEPITFKGATAMKSVCVGKDDIICWSEEVGLFTDSKVMFRVFKNSRGIGAYEVTNEDGSPIFFEPKEEREIQSAKMAKDMKPIIENEQYLNGNFRGALQEYLAKKFRGVTIEYETESMQTNKNSTLYVARCKVAGGNTNKFKQLVGTGHASLKNIAIQFSALEYMLKMNILTEDEHFRIHSSKKDGAIGDVPIYTR